MYLSIVWGGRLLVSCLPMQRQIHDEKELGRLFFTFDTAIAQFLQVSTTDPCKAIERL